MSKILQFYRKCTNPLLRQNLAKVDKLQFYKKKPAPGQKYRFWLLATLAKKDNSSILQENELTP